MIEFETLVANCPETVPLVAPACPRGPQVGGWQLTGRVGLGQWAGVYRARPVNASPTSASAYAVKMLQASRRHDPVAIEMIAREALVGRQLSHPHLIAILEAQVKRRRNSSSCRGWKAQHCKHVRWRGVYSIRRPCFGSPDKRPRPWLPWIERAGCMAISSQATFFSRPRAT